MTKKTVWLVNPYAYPPQYETRLRTIEHAKYLQENGYDVLIFGGSFIHNTSVNLIEGKDCCICREYDGLKFVHIKNDTYHGNGVKRFWSLIQFHHGFSKVATRFEKPDFIIHDITIPFGYRTYRIAKKLNAQYIAQIQDLWPESFVAFGLIKREGLIHKILRKIEFYTYSKADKIIFSMQGGLDYIKSQKEGSNFDVDKVFYLNNGVDLAQFEYDKLNHSLNDSDLEATDYFKVVYLGSIRLANGLDSLISAAEYLRDCSLKIFIYGDGDERSNLERIVQEKKLDNVIFKQKHIDISFVPYVVSQSDLNILNYQPNDIWKFGGSQSKLFQYLAAGKPILSNLEIGYCIVTSNQCGIVRKFESSEEYAKAIRDFNNMEPEQYQFMCENAKHAAEEYDYKKLTERLIQILEQ